MPAEPVQEIRDLTRTRKQLVREKSRHTLRIQKILEDANIKLSSVISNIPGQTGMEILNAIVAGENNAEHLADLANVHIKAPRRKLVEALEGRITRHHRFMIRLHLGQIGGLEMSIISIENQLEELCRPFEGDIARLSTIPGISDIQAMTILSEIGADMDRFPTAGHLISWAGLCTRMDESAHGLQIMTQKNAAYRGFFRAGKGKTLSSK